MSMGRGIRRLIHVGCVFILVSRCAASAENVICDASADTATYFCRGWQDGAGKNGSRVHFIARMMGDEDGDDFGFEIVPLGDINGDARGDFMVSVRNKCEWRIYLGDTLISKAPYMVWPKATPPYPCGSPGIGSFSVISDISGDGQPDLFRSVSTDPTSVEVYFAGSAFDTLPDFVIAHPDFIFPGCGGRCIDGGLDLSGDGQPDFVLGDPAFYQLSPKQNGRAYVFWGGTALDTIPDLIFSDTFWLSQHQPYEVGAPVVIFPSINGDPYAELVMGRASQDQVTKDPLGRVDVFYGGPEMDTVHDFRFHSPDTAYDASCSYRRATAFGFFAERVGDVDQDGNVDLLVSGNACVPAYVYYGGSTFDSVLDLRLTQPPPSEHGESDGIFPLGDVNGDAFPDFCTMALGNEIFGGWVRVHFSHLDPTGVMDWEIWGDDWLFASVGFGRSTTSLGDVDGDGFEDIAIGMETSQVEEYSKGGVYIFAGYDPDMISGIFDDPETSLPSDHRLIERIAPNPFNSGTTIQLGETFISGSVVIFNILGQAVRTIPVTGSELRSLPWDGRDDRGTTLASGLYFARATDGVRSETRKLVLLK